MLCKLNKYIKQQLAFAALLAIGILMIMVFGSGASAKPGENPIVEKQRSERVAPLGWDDYTLKNFYVGQSSWSVVQDAGEPSAKLQQEGGLSYRYEDVEIFVNSQNIVSRIYTASAGIATRRGIHPGSFVADVREAYGEETVKYSAGKYDVYEYCFTPNPFNKYILKFVVNTGEKVVKNMECLERKIGSAPKIEAGNLKLEDIGGEWLADYGPSGFYLKISIDEDRVIGSHSRWIRDGNMLDTSIGKTSITGVFNGSSPINVNWESGRDGEGTAEITMLDADSIWWHMTSSQGAGFLIPHEEVLHRKK